ncbi:MAG: hypothetical protein WDZ51_12335 [Pirellulaceae bacterium]
MKRLVIGECSFGSVFKMEDPDNPVEAEFTCTVVRALTCLFPGYRCIEFTGIFNYDDRGYRPDLALVAKDFSHWFIIEVELLSHSFDLHVLPQVIGFNYGNPRRECAEILSRSLEIPPDQARTFIEFVPRSVVVVANKYNSDWKVKLNTHGIQFLSVSSFRAGTGIEAIELNGNLDVVKEHLGFGLYLSTDRSIRFPATVRLPEGAVQITDLNGTPGIWHVVKQGIFTWLRKEKGTPSIEDKRLLQLMRSFDGSLVLRMPSA